MAKLMVKWDFVYTRYFKIDDKYFNKRFFVTIP